MMKDGSQLAVLRGTFSLAAMALIIAACGSGQDLMRGDHLLVLEGATLIDGTGAPPRPSAVVVLDGERILRVGSAGEFRFPAGTKVIPLRDRWLVPGFMDVHAHMNTATTPELQSEVLATMLAFGITTIRSPASFPMVGTELRDRIAAGAVLGPRMFTAGPLIDLPGGIWQDLPFHAGVRSVADVRAEVRRQVAGRVDYVKFYSQLEPELVRAGIEEAHAAGVRTIGHLGATSWTDAARMGIDVLVHSGAIGPTSELVPADQRKRFVNFHIPNPGFDPALFGPWRKAVNLDGPEMAVLISALVANNVEVNPNIVMTEVIYRLDEPQFLERTFEPRYAPALWEKEWRTAPKLPSTTWSPAAFAEAKATFPIIFEMVRRFHRAGILMTTGSDLGNSWITPGVSLHHEMELLQQAGISPGDILIIATRNGAKALGILDRVGTVEPGKRADLVVLRADPTADIRNTRSIDAVYLGGRLVTPPAKR